MPAGACFISRVESTGAKGLTLGGGRLAVRGMRFCLLFSFVFACTSAFALEQPLTAPAPSKWEKEIAKFEAKDKEAPPRQGGIVFIGSSSIRLWKTLAEDFPRHHVLNRGFGGSQIADSVAFAERIVIPYAPRMVVMYAGGNDINVGKSPEAVFADFVAFAGIVRAALPETEIAYISVAPNPKRRAQLEKVKAVNAMVANYCAKQPRMKFIDVFRHMLGADGLPKPDIFVADRLHMNDKGYRIWTEVVGKELPVADK